MQTDKEAFIEIMWGSLVILLVISIPLIIVWRLSPAFPDLPAKERFKVVDTYEDCEVLRYTDESNRYHYFLHCDADLP